MRYAILLALFGLTQNPTIEPNATVRQHRGIDVYHYSIPTRSYTVVKSGHFMNMGNGCDVDYGVQRALDKRAQGVIVTPEKNQWEIHTSNYQALISERKQLKAEISNGTYRQGKLTQVVNRLHLVNRLLNMYAIEIFVLPNSQKSE